MVATWRRESFVVDASPRELRDEPMRLGAPGRQGLYDPLFERDSCGVSFVCDIGGLLRTVWWRLGSSRFATLSIGGLWGLIRLLVTVLASSCRYLIGSCVMLLILSCLLLGSTPLGSGSCRRSVTGLSRPPRMLPRLFARRGCTLLGGVRCLWSRRCSGLGRVLLCLASGSCSCGETGSLGLSLTGVPTLFASGSSMRSGPGGLATAPLRTSTPRWVPLLLPMPACILLALALALLFTRGC